MLWYHLLSHAFEAPCFHVQQLLACPVHLDLLADLVQFQDEQNGGADPPPFRIQPKVSSVEYIVHRLPRLHELSEEGFVSFHPDIIVLIIRFDVSWMGDFLLWHIFVFELWVGRGIPREASSSLGGRGKLFETLELRVAVLRELLEGHWVGERLGHAPGGCDLLVKGKLFYVLARHLLIHLL